jgi:hypothetical protein
MKLKHIEFVGFLPVFYSIALFIIEVIQHGDSKDLSYIVYKLTEK